MVVMEVVAGEQDWATENDRVSEVVVQQEVATRRHHHMQVAVAAAVQDVMQVDRQRAQERTDSQL